MTKAVNKKRWEEIAREWDEGVGEKGDVRHELVINPIVEKFLGDLSGKVVLDAGCGNGYIARKMAKNAKKVVGVDFTEELVDIAKGKSKNLKNLEFKTASVEKLPFKDESFDVVLCNMVLMDLENLDAAVSEISRVVKRKGLVVISTQHPAFENAHKDYPLRNEKKEEIGRVVTDYFSPGLVVDKNENFPHYHWMLSQYLNAFSKNDLFLEETSEPNNKEILGSRMTEVVRNHTPMFIIFKLWKL